MADEPTSQPIDEEENLEEAPTGGAPAEDIEEAPDEPVDEVEEQEEAPEAEAEPAEVVEEEAQKETPPPSKRENLRIQKLIEKMKQQPQRTSPEVKEPEAGLDYRTALDADDEVYQKLETDRKTYGDNLYSKGVEQAKSIQFHTRLEIDAPKIASKYKQLDKESPEFNPAVASAVNEWYLATAGYNPEENSVQNANVRYADFVEGIFEMADEIAGQKVQKSSKNIAKQAATTGVRPDGSKAKRLDLTKDPSQMTDEELDAVINGAIPPK